MANENEKVEIIICNHGRITIRHQNEWKREKHDVAFLQPIIEGLLKRLELPAKE